MITATALGLALGLLPVAAQVSPATAPAPTPQPAPPTDPDATADEITDAFRSYAEDYAKERVEAALERERKREEGDKKAIRRGLREIRETITEARDHAEAEAGHIVQAHGDPEKLRDMETDLGVTAAENTAGIRAAGEFGRVLQQFGDRLLEGVSAGIYQPPEREAPEPELRAWVRQRLREREQRQQVTVGIQPTPPTPDPTATPPTPDDAASDGATGFSVPVDSPWTWVILAVIAWLVKMGYDRKTATTIANALASKNSPGALMQLVAGKNPKAAIAAAMLDAGINAKPVTPKDDPSGKA